MKLLPYPEYKDSGVPWIDSIPTHWSMERNKALFRPRRQIVGELHSEFTLLSLTLRGIIKRDLTNAKGKFPAEFNSYQAVSPGNFVFCLFDVDETPRTVGLSELYGMVTGAYNVYENQSPEPRYLYNYFLSMDDRKLLKPLYTGLRKVIQEDRFLRARSPQPPIDEQIQIARFLDWKTSQINKFVRNKRRLIELLKDQKQNVINQAVTRGLNPNVKLKPSGVEWIGDIPEHWKVAPLKHLASINARVLPESTDGYYTFKYFDISSVGTGCLKGEPEMLRFGQAPSRARRILKKGDTILSTVRTYLKAVYYVSDDAEDWIASTGFAVLTPKKEIHPPFLGLLIQSDNFINRVVRESIGVTYPAIAETKLGTLHLGYPVSFEEQQEIMEHIADSSKVIDQAISRAQREIELMREYRTRLISDVVTGQVDVRGIEVPDVAEDELLTLDEDTAETDDVMDDEGDMDETE